MRNHTPELCKEIEEALELSADALLILEKRKISYLNSACLNLLERSEKDDLIGRDVADVLPPTVWEPLMTILDPERGGHGTAAVGVSFPRRNGEQLSATALLVPFAPPAPSTLQITFLHEEMAQSHSPSLGFDDIQTIEAISEIALKRADPANAASDASRELSRLFGATCTLIYLLGQDGVSLDLQHTPCLGNIQEQLKREVWIEFPLERIRLPSSPFLEEALAHRAAKTFNDGASMNEVLCSGLMSIAEDKYLIPSEAEDFASQIEKSLGIQSCIIVPLTARKQSLGLILVFRAAPFTRGDQDRLERIAPHLALAMRRVKAQCAEIEYAAELSTLNQIGHDIKAETDPAKIACLAAEGISDRFPDCYVGVLLRNPNRPEELILHAGAGSAGEHIPLGRRITSGEGFAGWAYQRGKAYCCDDITRGPRPSGQGPIPKATRSVLCVPIQIAHEVLGVLDLRSHEFAAFDEHARILMETIANQVGIAIHNSDLCLNLRLELQERCRVGGALRMSEEKFRSLFMDSPTAQLEVDLSPVKRILDRYQEMELGDFKSYFLSNPKEAQRCLMAMRVRNVNHSTLALFVAPSKKELVRKFQALLGDGAMDFLVDSLVAIANNETSHSGECTLLNFSGEHLHIMVQWVALPDTTPPYKHVMVSLVDLTRIKRSENEVRALMHFNETVINSMTEGVIVENQDAAITFINPAGAEMLGYSFEELAQQPFDIILPAEQHELIEQVRARLREGCAYRYRLKVKRKDDSLLDILVAANPRMDGDQFLGCLSVFSDITKLRKTETQYRWESSINAALADVSRRLLDPSFSLQDLILLVQHHGLTLTESEYAFVISSRGNIHHSDGSASSAGIIIEPLSAAPPENDWDELVNDPSLLDRVIHANDSFYINNLNEAAIAGSNGTTLRNFLAVPVKPEGAPFDLVAFANSGRGYVKRDLRAIKRLVRLYAIALQHNRAKQIHLASEARYQGLVETSNDLIWRCNRKGELTYLNRAWEHTHGYKLDEMLGRTFANFQSPLAAQRDVEAFNKLRSGEPLTGYETTHIAKNGEKIHILLNALPLLDSEGNVIGMQGTAQDFTERKRIYEALIESEERFRSVAQTAADAIIIADEKGKIHFWNEAAVEMFGYSSQEILGNSIFSIIPQQHRQDFNIGLYHDSTGKHSEWIDRYPNLTGLRKNGEEFPIEISISFWTSNGKRWFSAIVRDQSEIVQAQERALAQERLAAIGQLAAGIAHDFNNMLVPIMLYSELLLSEPSLSERNREHLQTILLQARRASSLTNQILDFSRQGKIDFRPVELASFIEEFVNLIRRTLPENIHIHHISKGGDHLVYADQARLQQVLMNLALNAKDALPEGGDLSFRLDRVTIPIDEPPCFPSMTAGSWIKLTVADTGTGIPGEIISRIFEPFFTTKKRGMGTGLGLAQAYGIVKQHRGFITVDSAPGEGTSFHIYLPEYGASAAEAHEIHGAELLRGGQKTVLVVEDEEAVRNSIAEALELLDYRVLVAANGMEAIRLYEQHPIDLVISDLIMPQMGGDALFQKLQDRNPEIKMAILTGHIENEKLEEIQRLGIQKILNKPPDIQSLSAALWEVLGHSDGPT